MLRREIGILLVLNWNYVPSEHSVGPHVGPGWAKMWAAHLVPTPWDPIGAYMSCPHGL